MRSSHQHLNIRFLIDFLSREETNEFKFLLACIKKLSRTFPKSELRRWDNVFIWNKPKRRVRVTRSRKVSSLADTIDFSGINRATELKWNQLIRLGSWIWISKQSFSFIRFDWKAFSGESADEITEEATNEFGGSRFPGGFNC